MNSNLSYSPETPNLGQIWRFLEPCDLEIWGMTLKNNRAPLLSNIKIFALFHHHMWIQTGVTVRIRLSWVVTSMTLTFDLWPWSFAWTLLWSLVITPEDFMMIRWWEHSQKGMTDRFAKISKFGICQKTLHQTHLLKLLNKMCLVYSRYLFSRCVGFVCALCCLSYPVKWKLGKILRFAAQAISLSAMD